jgi:hypothetical protein
MSMHLGGTNLVRLMCMLLGGQLCTKGIGLHFQHMVLLGQLIMKLKLVMHGSREGKVLGSSTGRDRRTMQKRWPALEVGIAPGWSSTSPILIPRAEAASSSSVVQPTTPIPGWYARGDGRLLRLGFLKNGARRLLCWKLVLLACLLQLLAVRKQFERAPYLEMNPTPRIVVCGVTKIAIGAERLLHAKAVHTLLLATTRVPVLLFSFDAGTLSYWNSDLFVIDLVSVQPKEMKQQLCNALFVLLAITS